MSDEEKAECEGLTANCLCISKKIASAAVEDLGTIVTTTILIILIVIKPTYLLRDSPQFYVAC